MSGAAERARIDGERDLALAHTTALFMRVKKLDPLNRYMRRKAKSGGAMLDRLRAISARTKDL